MALRVLDFSDAYTQDMFAFLRKFTNIFSNENTTVNTVFAFVSQVSNKLGCRNTNTSYTSKKLSVHAVAILTKMSIDVILS